MCWNIETSTISDYTIFLENWHSIMYRLPLQFNLNHETGYSKSIKEILSSSFH